MCVYAAVAYRRASVLLLSFIDYILPFSSLTHYVLPSSVQKKKSGCLYPYPLEGREVRSIKEREAKNKKLFVPYIFFPLLFSIQSISQDRVGERGNEGEKKWDEEIDGKRPTK